MEAADEALLNRQVEAELKNALKSEERKKKQKRKLSDKPEPPKKKEKKSTVIPTSVNDLKEIRKRFYTSVVYLPLLDKIALYSGLTNETMCFACYPILLGPCEKKDNKNVPKDYILGVTKPSVIFTVLRDIFEKLYPERNSLDFMNWEVYRSNRSYYTVKVEKASYSQDVLELQMVETKPFGGPKDPPSVHWLEENKLKRWVKTISLEEYFKDKDPNKIKPPPIPKGTKPWPSNHLQYINQKVENLKKDLLLAQETATVELNKKEIAEAMNNLKDSSGEESDEESE